MSKSDENVNATIYLIDDKDTIIRKFKKAVTDSEAQVRYDVENKPGVSNLMEIYGVVTDKSMDQVEKEFEGKGYGDFKMAVGEAVADMLEPFHARCKELEQDKTFINECIKENAEKASYFANKTLRKVHKKLGLTERIR